MVELEGKTFLIVDDEPDLLDVLELELSFRGIVVLRAGSGNEGARVAAQEKVDLVLSDIRMPDGDGVDLVRTLRARDPARPPLLFMSGFTDLSARMVYAMGVEGFLGKPFRLNEIVARAGQVLAPRPEAWAREPDDRRALPVLATSGQAVLGRGGFRIAVSGAEAPRPGQRVTFAVQAGADGERLALDGAGTVRWAEACPATGAAVGVEIDWLNDATREPAARAVAKVPCVAFIPA